MRFELLGPLTVSQDGQQIEIRGRIRRGMLTALLLDANRVVSVDRLRTVLWGEDASSVGTATIHNQVMRLRKQLGVDVGARIRTSAPGYLIEVLDRELDVEVFEALCGRGRRALQAGDWQLVSTEMTAALQLWRAEPCPELLETATGTALAHKLAELRLSALTARIDADLNLGLHGEVIAEIRMLCEENPLSEAFHRQLMLALYRAGRRAEAFDVFALLRTTLVDELGVEPSAPVQDLYRSMLNADPELTLPAAAPAGSGASASAADSASETPSEPESATAAPRPEPVPAQLPMGIPDFAGRKDDVHELCRLLSRRDAEGPARPVVISAVTGIGGLGKTTLAVHVGHSALTDFPDGQIFVNLRGFGGSPQEPADVLAGMLRDLGEPESSIPPDEEGRSARFRSLTAGRRMLIVLDDARDTAHVRPLLPGSGACAVVVTSRRRLPGLAGAVPLHLDALTRAEALELFTSVVGAARVNAEPDAVEQVLGYCGGLPLALRIAAARLASRPNWTIASLADRLSDEYRRLDELRVEDVEVRANFRMSYTSLADADSEGGSAAEGLARAFRLLGLIPGPDFTAYAAAALFEQPLHRAEDLLEGLVDANLLEDASPGRYRLHDLLRDFAGELVRDEESEDARHAALLRFAGWHLFMVHQAEETISGRKLSCDISAWAVTEPPLALADRNRAIAWNEDERANVAALIHRAEAMRLGPITWIMPNCLLDFYEMRGLFADHMALAEVGRRAAHDAGDLRGEAGLLLHISAHQGWNLGQFELAVDSNRAAMRIYEQLGDRRNVARCSAFGATILVKNGRTQEALELGRESVEIYRQLDFPIELSFALNSLACNYSDAGLHAEVLEPATEALAIVRSLAARPHQAVVLDTLGVAYHHLGRLDEAIAALREAYEIHVEVDDQYLLADTLDHLADALLAKGDVSEACECWYRAADMFEEVDAARTRKIRAKIIEVELESGTDAQS